VARLILASSLAPLLLPLLAAAQTPATSSSSDRITVEAPTQTVIEVERLEHKEPKHVTVQLLIENRDFFRGRLDDLLMATRLHRSGEAQEIDPRFLRYRDMLAAILAAKDSAQASEEWIRRRELLESVGALVELETEMDEMETLLGDQRDRLVWLEEDFVGRQETSLVLLLSGVPAIGSPHTVILRDDTGETIRVTLSDRDREALAAGGTTELLHEFVEPRFHAYELSFEGPGWSAASPFEIAVEPERDRLTFLELDVAGANASGAAPIARSWVR
jgi:hypothetical protein